MCKHLAMVVYFAIINQLQLVFAAITKKKTINTMKYNGIRDHIIEDNLNNLNNGHPLSYKKGRQ